MEASLLEQSGMVSPPLLWLAVVFAVAYLLGMSVGDRCDDTQHPRCPECGGRDWKHLGESIFKCCNCGAKAVFRR